MPTVERSSIRATARPERPTLARGHGRARFLLELEANHPCAGERHLVVALDRSSSMRGRALRDAVRALRTLVRAAPEGTALSALAFDASITRLFPKTRLDGRSRPLLLGRLNGIQAGLGTDHSGALLDGFALGNDSGGAAHLLLITDGYPSRGITHLDQLVELVTRGRGQTTLSTLGIGPHAEGWVLGALARTGGGIYQQAPGPSAIEPAVGAELGLLQGLYAPDVRIRFLARAPVRLRKLYQRGPAWRDGDTRVVRLPRLVHGEPLELAFELEREPGEDGRHDPSRWGLVEVRLTTADGREERLELALPAHFADRPGATDPAVVAAILRHRVGIAIIDACTAGDRDAPRAAGWLKQRLAELRALATDHQVQDPALHAAFAHARQLRKSLQADALDAKAKNDLSHLAEECTRTFGSLVEPVPLDRNPYGTRVSGIRMMESHRDDD